MRRKGCQRKWKEDNCSARQITPRKGPRPSWFHARSNNLREPRETESKLQTWTSNPNSSGSRNWPKEEFEQSDDLRVDGIPNDETYKGRAVHAKNCRTSSKTCHYGNILQKKTHLRTTFQVRMPRRKFMKQATANCMQFSKGLTKCNVSVAIHT